MILFMKTNMDLPKINERKQQSKIEQTTLSMSIYRTIEKYQKDNNYVFEPYEIDNVLLNMIKKNHESYLNAKFGFDAI